MKGFPLSCYPKELHEIHPNANPACTVRDIKKKLAPYRECIEEWRGWPSSRSDFIDLCVHLPRQCLSTFSFEDIAKIYFSSLIQMERSVFEMFEKRAEYDLVRKLRNSMWRWGAGGKNGRDWNTMVRAYHSIRQFDFGVHGFTTRLDYTAWFHPRGYTKCSRTYIDGVFGFLIYHNDVYVMTIGFSVASGDRLLVTQVQLVNEKGNRFLYKLQCGNYVDHVLIQLALAFRNFKIFLIDGTSLGSDLLQHYRKGLCQSRHDLCDLRKYPDDDVKEQSRRITRTIERYREIKRNTILCREAGIRMRHIYGELRMHKRIIEQPLEIRKLLFHPVMPILCSV